MATPALPPTIKESRPDEREALAALVKVTKALSAGAALQDQRMIGRNTMLYRLRNESQPPVSWADLARICGISDVSVMQAVERFAREHPDLCQPATI